MSNAQDPLGWAEIANKIGMYQAADAMNGWPAGTAAANNGEPGFGGQFPVVPANTGTGPTPAAGITGVTTPTPAAADTTAADNRASFTMLKSVLDEAGLGNLYSVDGAGNPSGWLWQQIVSGAADTVATLGLAIEQTSEWQTRYKVIKDLRAQQAANPTSVVSIPSMAQVREYETTAKQMMSAAGMPAWFYDEITDLQGLMGKGISLQSLEKRIGTAYSRVQNTDPAIRQAYSEFYGIGQGDAALAATFLDPDKSEQQLEKASRAAYTAGLGRTMGINVDKTMAERIAMLPKTEGGILQDLSEVSKLGDVFIEGITETQDLTAETTGLGAVALGSGADAGLIERRILERQANSRATVGGALSTNAGITGLGSS